MGCVVNGPGEMADANYGYIGAGNGKVNLYKRQELIGKDIAEAEAVETLIGLIKDSGDWREPGSISRNDPQAT
jgi:(E)-4-hydroxy-3-methylbut-2-enyl-diphosphate synthase